MSNLSPTQHQLFNAVQKHDHSTVSRILNDNPSLNINCIDTSGWTPWMYATKNGDHHTLQAFFDHRLCASDLNSFKTMINTQHGQGLTPLMIAVSSGKEEAVLLLLKNGADINATTPRCETALMFAAQKSLPNIVKALLKAGASPSILDTVNIKTGVVIQYS